MTSRRYWRLVLTDLALCYGWVACAALFGILLPRLCG